MEQTEFWRDLEREFSRFSNDDSEQLVVRWTSNTEIWSFEGAPYWERIFKALAARGGFGLAGGSHADNAEAWLHELRERGLFRRTQTLEAKISVQDRHPHALPTPVVQRKRGALLAAFYAKQAREGFIGVIEQPFRNSVLLCLELSAEALANKEAPISDLYPGLYPALVPDLIPGSIEVGPYTFGDSPEFCHDLGVLAAESDEAAGSSGGTRLQRGRYPFCYWLDAHAHDPLPDPMAELNYWKDHVWRGYHVLIENCERMGMSEVDRREKLSFAVGGLSYDLAVVQANYVIGRGLRGEEARRTFWDEAAALLEEVTSSWRASCERLAILFEDDTEELKNLEQPFHRVRDDLRRLLHDLPPAHVQGIESEPPSLESAIADLSQSANAATSGGGRRDKQKSERQEFMAPYLEKKRTLSAIATGSGVMHSSLHRWHNGLLQLRPENVNKLADHLNVDSGKIPN